MSPRAVLAILLSGATLLPAALHSEEITAEPTSAVLHQVSTTWRAVVTRGPAEPGARALFIEADAGRLAVKVSRGRRPASPDEPGPATDLLRVLQEGCTPLPMQRAAADPVPRARVVSLEF
jgi:hypothetical protein